jgi:carbon storage regulator
MLVLTRKTGQKLIIANDIEITILETRGESVKIGIQAPQNVPIYREEIFEEIRKANQQATREARTGSLEVLAETIHRIKPDPSPSQES